MHHFLFFLCFSRVLRVVARGFGDYGQFSVNLIFFCGRTLWTLSRLILCRMVLTLALAGVVVAVLGRVFLVMLLKLLVFYMIIRILHYKHRLKPKSKKR